MRWADGFIAADWGTTNRRAYLIDSSGSCVQEFEDDQGILSVAAGGFPAAVAEIRERLGDHPLILAGMVGSNRGWIEAPYVAAPASIQDLASNVARVDERVVIVPGVSLLSGDRADVMRGEEVQILGAVADGEVPGDCLICHPGTHNKWIAVRGGRIASFRTVMTGELFNMLRERSILSDLLAEEVHAGDAFRAGVRRGLAGAALTAELFTVRARVLLGAGNRVDAASFTSGLLIGTDIAAGLGDHEADEVIVMGRPELTGLFACALEEAGRRSREIDGERAFLSGASKIVELIA